MLVRRMRRRLRLLLSGRLPCGCDRSAPHYRFGWKPYDPAGASEFPAVARSWIAEDGSVHIAVN